MFNVHFRYVSDGEPYEIVKDGSDWNSARHVPRVGEDIYLGDHGVYYWYTVKGIQWFDSKAVNVIIHDKREMIEE